MTAPLRILMTNAVMSGRTGTEIVTRDIALGLLQAGHLPTIYSPSCGAIAEELISNGIPVKASVAELEGPFDIIHGNHLAACAGALARFPQAPALAVCHDGESWFDAPPVLPNITAYAAVSEAIRARVMVEAGLQREQVELILNGVDMQRFAPGDPLPARPRRALAFAKNAGHVEAVRAACAARGISVEFIGAAVGALISNPESALPRYDLIFASAVSAIEAMACLRPVIVCDGRGLAGMVDRERLDAWRPHNFGSAVLKGQLTADSVAAEIDRYDAAEAQAVGRLVRERAGVPAWVRAYEHAYARAMARFRPASEAERDLAWARHLERWAPRSNPDWRWTLERQSLLIDLRRHIAGLDLMPRGRAVKLGNSLEARALAAMTGFDGQNGDSVWTHRDVASVRMHLGELRNDLKAVIDYAVYSPERHAGRDVKVLVNGVPATQWNEPGEIGWRAGRREIPLPRAACQGLATWLTFCFSPAPGATPVLGQSFALQSIRIDA